MQFNWRTLAIAAVLGVLAYLAWRKFQTQNAESTTTKEG